MTALLSGVVLVVDGLDRGRCAQLAVALRDYRVRLRADGTFPEPWLAELETAVSAGVTSCQAVPSLAFVVGSADGGGSHEDAVPADQLVLTVEEAARALAVSTSTVWRMLRSGALTRVRLRGATRVRADEIDEITTMRSA